MYIYQIKSNIFPRIGLAVLMGLLSWLALGGLFPADTLAYSGGNGTSGNPYQISTVADLQQVRTDAANGASTNKYYKLMNDIDLSGVANWEPIGASYYWAFKGSFDGNHHVIKNLTIDRTGTNYAGLFGYVIGDANIEIKNLGLENVNVKGSNYTGGLAGFTAWRVTIRQCYVTGSVSGNNNVGVLAGVTESNTASECYADVNMTGVDHIGGLVGSNYYTRIHHCYATGSVSGTGFGRGGLAGLNDEEGKIEKCYAAGRVTGSEYHVGGLVGYNEYQESAEVIESVWDVETSGQSKAGSGVSYCKGKTTAEIRPRAS